MKKSILLSILTAFALVSMPLGADTPLTQEPVTTQSTMSVNPKDSNPAPLSTPADKLNARAPVVTPVVGDPPPVCSK